MKLQTFLFRLISLPFFAGLTLIGYLYIWLTTVFCFLSQGGEVIAYTKKNSKPMIADVYAKVKELVDSERDN